MTPPDLPRVRLLVALIAELCRQLQQSARPEHEAYAAAAIAELQAHLTRVGLAAYDAGVAAGFEQALARARDRVLEDTQYRAALEALLTSIPTIQ